ncbi:MAG TPA: response regulator [Noviherbaspirillum sp.]
MKKQLPVLIVNDLQSMRHAMSAALQEIGIKEVLQAINGVDAIRILKTERVSAVISEWKMPGLGGLDLLRWMRNDPVLADLPFMMVTSESSPAQMRTAITSGASEYLVKPYTMQDFSNKVKRLLGGYQHDMPLAAQANNKVLGLTDITDVEQRVGGSTVLVVDDVQTNIDIIVEILKDEYAVQTASSGHDALQITHSSQPPDLILLDIMMPGLDGREVCRKLKADPVTRNIPIIFLTSQDDVDEVIYGLEIGAVDYIVKPAEPGILKARIRTHLYLKWTLANLLRQNMALADSARLREDVERITQNDLRKPIKSIIARTDVLLNDGLLNESYMQLAHFIRAEAWKMIDQLNQSLSLYQMESGTFVFQAEPVDLVTMLSRVRQEMLAEFSRLRLDIGLTGEGGSAAELRRYIVQGEEGLCYSLFRNLMRNAAEASGEGACINVSFSIEPSNVVVAIRNTGLVPAAIRDRFFNKYVTAGKAQGSGLGAYSAKLATEAQGGTIAMDTDEAQGTTTVTVRLPKRS